MEDVDNIIIESLKNLKCDNYGELRSLKHFTRDMIITSIIACLKSISPELKLPHELDPSMTARLKLATSLSGHIKNLGFRGDMGYQTILYSNEVEVRRVLMFLIERLPMEANKSITFEEVGYVPRLVKEIEQNMHLALEKPWVPSSIVQLGSREYSEGYVKQTCGISVPLQTFNLEVPKTKSDCSDALKHYWVHHLAVVTKQCSPKNLIPSLLFQDNEYTCEHIKISMKSAHLKIDTKIESVSNVNSYLETEVIPNFKEAELENVLETLNKEVDKYKEKLNTIQEEHRSSELKLNQLTTKKDDEQKKLDEMLSTLKVKTKTLTVLSKEENMEKLRNLVENGSERLVDLANQWNEVQSPLLEQYRSLQNSLSSQELRMKEGQDRFQRIKDKIASITTELKEKSTLEKQLTQECTKIVTNTNRSAYTRRIMEIIGNIKKQDQDIEKVLKDTREVQKDINNLNGQLDRSFLISDEIIFRDAKQDDTARKAYKFLANFHNDCGEIAQAMTSFGLVEREIRNLQEQVENMKDTGANLKSVNLDLHEVRKETANLLKSKENTNKVHYC